MSTNGEGSTSDASEIKFNLWREQTTVFQDVSGYYLGSVNLTSVDRPQRAYAIFVTGDYFRLFGLPIAQGRSFTNEEERPNGANAVVLSEAFWKRAFGGDPRIVGKIIHSAVAVMKLPVSWREVSKQRLLNLPMFGFLFQ